MRKKFVTVALLGALALTSTHFVGCKDYDDDISRLQEQVDALKSISISDLASQLQSLKDANGNLTLASAKMEAAIAEIKTNIEALKEADKTLTSLVNGKVDQATYKAAIDALNAKCSDLSAKVAALSALETAVNDLKANKADKATMDALQAAVKALEAKDTEFATQLASLKSTVEGMNSVLAGKVDKATADALKESIDALKVSVNGIDSKVSKALEPIQASIAKLQEDLANKANAATIAADIAKVKSEMTSVTDALKLETASNLAGVKAELAGRIAALETAKGQMEVQIGKLQSDLGALKDRVTALENKPTTDINEVKAAIAANKTAIESAQTTIGSIQGTINGITSRLDGIGVEAGAVKNYIDNAILTLSSTISTQITTSIGAAVSSLQSEYKQADTDLAARIAALESLEHVDKTEFTQLKGDFNTLKATIGDAENGLVKQLNDLDTKVGSLISDAIAATGPGTIAEAITKQISATLENSEVIKAAIETAISSLTGRVDKIAADLDAVLQRIQSIVFVPQYKDANGTSIVPVYAINNANGTVEMTFRISPIDKVAALVDAAKINPAGVFSFYQEDELQSRATSETALTAVEVRAGVNAGTIVIKAQVSNLAANTSGSFYPVALKLSTSKDYGTAETPDNKPVNDVTTEYFNVRVTDIDVPGCTVIEPSVNIVYTNTQEQLVNSNVVNVTSNLTLAHCGFTQNLELYSVYCSDRWVKLSSTVQSDKNAIAAELQAKGFELVGKTAVKLSSPININRIGNTLKVQLADNKNLFGLTGNIPNKLFEVTYLVGKSDIAGAIIDYRTITKASLQTGSTTDNFDVDDKAPELFVWKNSASNGTQTFIIKAEKAAEFTDQLIVGATGAEILAAIKALAPANIIHKIGNATATAADPTFNFDVDNDKVTVNLPASALYKTYAMSTVYRTTTYGDIVLKATLKLAYPTAADLWEHKVVRWANPTTYFLEYTPDVSAAYDINDDLEAGYTYKNTDVTYSYELVKTIDTNNDKIADAVPTGVTITSDGKIVFTKYIDLKYVKVKFAAKIANNVAASEEFTIQMTYPITDRIASKSYTYTKAAMLANTPLNIITGFNLKDRFGKADSDVVKDGEIQTYGSTTYRMKTGSTPTLTGGKVFSVTGGIRYTVKDGKVAGSAQTISALEYFDISSDGEFSLKKNINLATNVTIEVQAAVDYTYGTVTSEVFTITLEPTL